MRYPLIGDHGWAGIGICPFLEICEWVGMGAKTPAKTLGCQVFHGSVPNGYNTLF